jgi:transcriptional regulator with XRE-family HTH domain
VTARSAHVERPPWYAPFLIREIRHKLSVSQAIFAEMLGVSASSVRAIRHPREGWDAIFAEMARRGDDKLLDDVPSTSTWDEEEWEW